MIFPSCSPVFIMATLAQAANKSVSCLSKTVRLSVRVSLSSASSAIILPVSSVCYSFKEETSWAEQCHNCSFKQKKYLYIWFTLDHVISLTNRKNALLLLLLGNSCHTSSMTQIVAKLISKRYIWACF